MDDMISIYIWPNGKWCFEQNLRMYKDNNGPEHTKHRVSVDLDAEDITELIELNAFPGMLPDKITISGAGKLLIPENDMLVITFDEKKTHIITVEGKYIITGPSTEVECKKVPHVKK